MIQINSNHATTMHYWCMFAITVLLSSNHDVAVVTAEGIRTHPLRRAAEQQPPEHRHLTECESFRACYLVNIETRQETKLIPGKSAENTVALDVTNHPRGYSIRCDVTDTSQGELDFIQFLYDDMVHEEFGLPRYMFGDSDMGDWINPVPYLQSCGRKVIQIQGHVWSKKCFDRTFYINMKCSDRDTCPNAITNLILVDTIQRTDIMELTDYSIQSTMPRNQLNIRAVPNDCVPKTTESVKFIFNNNTIVRCEKYIPYALFGDPSPMDRIPDGSHYNAKPISMGTHTITAIPYTGEACSGTKGTAFTRTFTVTA